MTVTASVRAMGAPVTQSASSSALSLVVPAGAQSGDTLIAFVYSQNTTRVAPAGWTLVPSNSNDVVVYAKRCVAGDPGSTVQFTSSSSSAGYFDGVIGSFQNALAVDQIALSFSNSNTTSQRGAPLTTGYDNELVVNFWVITSSSSQVTLTPPATAQVTAKGAASFAISTQAQATAGAVAQPLCSGTPAATWFVLSFSLRSDSPPNAPNITSPANGFYFNRATDLVVQAPFSDPDSGDMPSQLIRQIRSSTVSPTPPWTVTKTSGTAQQTTIPGGTLASDDYEVQIAYRDSFGIPVNDSDLQFSPSLHISPRDAPGAPSFTDPPNGASINTSSQTYGIASDQAFDSGWWRQLGDDGNGNPDPSQVINGPHALASTDRSFTATGLPNNTTVHTLLSVTRAGVTSAETDNVNPVTYTPPPAAVVFVGGGYSPSNDGPMAEPDCLNVEFETPAPGSGNPAAVGAWVLLSQDGGATSIRVSELLAASDVWTYWTPASGVEYSFAVVTVADNGTTSQSAWVTTSLGAYGEGPYGAGEYGGGS